MPSLGFEPVTFALIPLLGPEVLAVRLKPQAIVFPLLWGTTYISGILRMKTKRWVLCVTSVKFAPDGRHIVVGLNNSKVQLWDFTVNRLLRTLATYHELVLRTGTIKY
ncbi:hypothetical protein ACS0TY_002051 [Phlomoides rotata]